jgi:hypothetical protein
MKSAIAITGLLAAVSVQAQQRGMYDLWSYDGPTGLRQTSPQVLASDVGTSYNVPLSRRSAVFGSIGLPGEPAIGPPASYTRHFADLDNPQAPLFNDQLDFQGPISQVFTLGYRWRSVRVEGSAFSPRTQDERLIRTESLRLRSRSGRLSFSPAPNLSFQFSRGTLSNLDQLDPNGEVRRTTLSATYKRNFEALDWQTTLAWGRNAKRYRESSYGYLLESSLKLANAHAFFSRVEQVGSDDILRENESNRRETFKLNKLTFGYVYELRPSRHHGTDVGMLMSRHYVPSAMESTYGSNPVSYMMFVRLKLK